jgi:hypothetical protein
MNAKPLIHLVVPFCVLVIWAGPARAVSDEPVVVEHLNRYNSAGVSVRPLIGFVGNLCYLSNVGVEETDTGGESAACEVRRSGDGWELRAFLGRDSDADVYCGATCYSIR